MATPQVVDMRSDALDMMEHLEWTLNGRRGYLALGLWSIHTKKMREHFFHWPKQKEELYKWLETHRHDEWTEIFYCPLPRQTSGKRHQDDAASYGVLWADVDEELPEAVTGVLRGWGARLVATGRPGARHVYLRLREPLTVVEWQGYQKSLREYVSGDAKIADNDFLKLPGSWNYKNHTSVPARSRLKEPILSQVVVRGRVVSDITKLLIPVMSDQDISNGVSSDWSGVDMPVKIPDYLRAIMHERPGEDRSRQCMTAVWTIADCKIQQYTVEQCHVMLNEYAPGVEKYKSKWHNEIDRLWGKWIDKNYGSRGSYSGVIDTKNLPVPMSDEAERKFFVESDRELLRHIYQSCLCSQANPWAVWGIVKLRMLHMVPARVFIPHKLGDSRTLNTFVALVGSSGVGKGAATRTAKQCVDVGQDIHTRMVGSGQGIPKMYRRWNEKERKWEILTNAVLLGVDEVATWNSLGVSKESTLNAELAKAFMGETLGYGWADESKAAVVDEDSYRMGLYVGVQPAESGALFDKGSMGLPQRFVWMPTGWPTAPDRPTRMPKPYVWHGPEWPAKEGKWRGGSVDEKGRYTMDMCEEAREEIIQTRTRQVRQEEKAYPLDSHRMLVRNKVACALAIADGRTYVNEQDWELSGLEMTVSDATRQFARDELERHKALQSKKKGRERAHERRGEFKESKRLEEQDIRKAAQQIKRCMDNAGEDSMPYVRVRNVVTRSLQEHMERAIHLLGYRIEEASEHRKGKRIVR